jgi:hypothetical protein
MMVGPNRLSGGMGLKRPVAPGGQWRVQALPAARPRCRRDVRTVHAQSKGRGDFQVGQPDMHSTLFYLSKGFQIESNLKG